MKSKIIYILLGFSLGLNVSLGGGYLARWIHEDRAPPAVETQFTDIGEGLPPSVRKQLAMERKKRMPQFRKMHREIRDARIKLFKALQEYPPDRKKINTCLDHLIRMQEQRQNLIINRILQETGSMSPEERRTYFQLLENKFSKKFSNNDGLPRLHKHREPGSFHNKEGRK